MKRAGGCHIHNLGACYKMANILLEVIPNQNPLKNRVLVMAKGLEAVLLLQLTVTVLVCMATVAAQPKPGCRSTCGDVQIPYPFGTEEGCYRDVAFLVTCYNTSSSGYPKANYSTSTIPVLNISLDGEMRISPSVSLDCYHGQYHSWLLQQLWFRHFAISNVKNKFTVVGCDTVGYLSERNYRFSTGCSLTCRNITYLVNGSCSGVGCCQTSFPKAIKSYNISLSSYSNHTYVQDFNPCGYAFLVQDGFYNFTIQDLKDLRNKTEFPVVMNWAIENKTCSEAMKNTTSYACKENSYCYESESSLGYLCNCTQGYEGNPYLDGGCKDVDECKTMNPCNITSTCQNLPGSYSCHCPRGYQGDGDNIKGEGCNLKSKKLLVTQIALGGTAGLLVLVILMSSLCWVHKQRTIEQLRRKHFEQNGGLMLEEQLSEGQQTKIFKEVELKKATDNFHEGKIIGRGGHGVVYKGILPHELPVAIKKSSTGVVREVKDFIYEMIVLSQIKHTNVVNLLGFCLETKIPLLVYEFVSNGTLLEHLHPTKNECTISWETRLQIAADTAEAISYLHSCSNPIIHRDIKSSNVLLDENNKAKVSDFGASRLVPLDPTQVATLVQGTPGYVDPEYVHTGQLNEKSDVYSFGVVLMELLTGKKAIEFNGAKQKKHLAKEFVCLMEEGRLLEILDGRVMNETNVDQLKKVALLAVSCVNMKGKERPSMKKIAVELQGLIMAMEKHPRVKGDVIPGENEYLVGEVSGSYGDAGIGSSAGYDSIQNQMPFEIGNGR